MASTGLRLGEALALDRADVDLDDGSKPGRYQPPDALLAFLESL